MHGLHDNIIMPVIYKQFHDFIQVSFEWIHQPPPTEEQELTHSLTHACMHDCRHIQMDVCYAYTQRDTQIGKRQVNHQKQRYLYLYLICHSSKHCYRLSSTPKLEQRLNKNHKAILLRAPKWPAAALQTTIIFFLLYLLLYFKMLYLGIALHVNIIHNSLW